MSLIIDYYPGKDDIFMHLSVANTRRKCTKVMLFWLGIKVQMVPPLRRSALTVQREREKGRRKTCKRATVIIAQRCRLE